MQGLKTFARISVVVPVYSGERYLRQLVGDLDTIRQGWANEQRAIELAEVILVDDAAVDGSSYLIDGLKREYDWVTAIHLGRNFGQHPATIAGVLHSSGDWIATIDEDGQHPPSKIYELLLAAVKNEEDIVYGRSSKVHGSIYRDWSSAFSKKLVSLISGNSKISSFSSFRLIRGPVARAAASVCAHDTYFDVALTWFSQRIITVPFELKDMRVRSGGSGGYGFRTLLSHMRRLFVSSGVKVMRLGAVAGLIAVVVSLMMLVVIFIWKLLDPSAFAVRGWASIASLILLVGGILMLQLSIALEYLSTLMIYHQGKPTFFVIDRSLDEMIRQDIER